MRCCDKQLHLRLPSIVPMILHLTIMISMVYPNER